MPDLALDLFGYLDMGKVGFSAEFGSLAEFGFVQDLGGLHPEAALQLRDGLQEQEPQEQVVDPCNTAIKSVNHPWFVDTLDPCRARLTHDVVSGIQKRRAGSGGLFSAGRADPLAS